MRKSTVILAVLALVGASCTKIQIAESSDSSPSKGAISLSAYTAMPTKAAQTDVINDDFTSFQVSAIGNGAKYFDNVTFTKNSEGVWASSPAYFWPVYALDFYAYNTPADGNGTFSRNITTSSPQTLKYSPSAELAKQEDLVAASVTGQHESNNNSKGAIKLTFNHYLTQVVVNALCSNSNYTVVVDGVKLANMAGEGTYTFSDSKMTATSGKVNSEGSTDYDETFTAKTLTSAPSEVMTNGGKGKWYLVPQTVKPWKRVVGESETPEMTNASHGTYLALKVKITSKGGSNVYPYSGSKTAWMAVPVPAELAFAQGKKYNVTIKFFGEDGKGGAGYVDPEDPGELDGNQSTSDAGKSIVGGAIKFDATVSEWGNAVDITISL